MSPNPLWGHYGDKNKEYNCYLIDLQDSRKCIYFPGGKFLIVNEDDGLYGNNEKWEKMTEGMHTYAPDELKADLSAAGFRDIVVHLNESKHRLCATAIK